MRRRRGARRNPTGTQWALIGGGVAITGIVAYLIYKSSSSATPQPAPAQVTTTPSPVLTPPVVAPPPHITQLNPSPTAAKYSQTFVDGGKIALVVGDTVQLLPPGPAAPGARWEFQTVNQSVLQTFAYGDNTAGSNTSVDEGDFRAVAPGTVTVMARQYIPRAGPTQAPPLQMTVAVSANISPVLQG